MLAVTAVCFSELDLRRGTDQRVNPASLKRMAEEKDANSESIADRVKARRSEQKVPSWKEMFGTRPRGRSSTGRPKYGLPFAEHFLTRFSAHNRRRSSIRGPTDAPPSGHSVDRPLIDQEPAIHVQEVQTGTLILPMPFGDVFVMYLKINCNPFLNQLSPRLSTLTSRMSIHLSKDLLQHQFPSGLTPSIARRRQSW